MLSNKLPMHFFAVLVSYLLQTLFLHNFGTSFGLNSFTLLLLSILSFHNYILLYMQAPSSESKTCTTSFSSKLYLNFIASKPNLTQSLFTSE